MNEQPPKLPTSVSSNGQEIWDWAAKLSAFGQRQSKIRDIASDLRKLGKECGDCYLWMKSDFCPREQNVSGRRHGPSMLAPTCSKYVECPSATKRREELHGQLAALQADDHQ